jgi:glutathione synthase/RimK-type ligase-like ATP-grasp enzyme
MKVAVLNGKYGCLGRFARRMIAILEFNGIRPVLLDVNDPGFWKELRSTTHFIYRWTQNDYDRQIALTLLPIIEQEYGIRCFPNSRTCWSYDDKVRQYYLMQARGFPMVESYVFWDRRQALQWAGQAAYPVVFKLKSGASSNSVILVETPAAARRMIRRMFGRGIVPGHLPSWQAAKWKDFSWFHHVKRAFGSVGRRLRGRDPESVWVPNKSYVLFQKFLPGNAFDTRVTVVGGRAYAFRRLNRRDDFRSSGSGKLDFDPTKIDLRHVQVALRISRDLDFQSMAYDFLYDEKGEPAFCEISYTYVDQAPYDCPGHWDSGLTWHEGHCWPQYLILCDLLEGAVLKPPPGGTPADGPVHA